MTCPFCGQLMTLAAEQPAAGGEPAMREWECACTVGPDGEGPRAIVWEVAGDENDFSEAEPGASIDLGPCCGCDRCGPSVRNVTMLPYRVPAGGEGKGWGCAQCGLPADGAVSVLCDVCLEACPPDRLMRVCVGYPKDGVRADLGAAELVLFLSMTCAGIRGRVAVICRRAAAVVYPRG